MKPTYKFSIVSAVYNTAEYLEEMIESVINQDIGFEEHVQLVLINDGSTDCSHTICQKYSKQYPYNIIYVKTENKGVSHARNMGLQEVKGTYINFLDSDDKLELNALSEVENFFREYTDEVDLVAVPLYFFDKEEGEHVLNYKFKESQVVDISQKADYIQLSSSSTFIKAKVMDKYRFNTKLRYAEDAQLVTKVILEKGKYGVINTTKYYYRKRQNQSSAIQNSHNKEWYLDSIKLFSKELIELSKQVEVNYQPYIKYVVMYDLKWKINKLKNIRQILNEEEYREFYSILMFIIQEINKDIIMGQAQLRCCRKILLLALKYSKRDKCSQKIFGILNTI